MLRRSRHRSLRRFGGHRERARGPTLRGESLLSRGVERNRQRVEYVRVPFWCCAIHRLHRRAYARIPSCVNYAKGRGLRARAGAPLSIVGQLVARNTDLERRIARLAARFKASEQVPNAQLVLSLDALKRRPEPPAPEGEATDDHAALVTADDELRTASRDR